MNIALCFSGQVRTLDENIDSIKKYILDKLPVKPDIFCYFSDCAKSDVLNSFANHCEIVYAKDPELDLKDYEKNISDTQWINYKTKKSAKDGARCNLLQWYFIKKCNELKSKYEQEQGFRYDWVIWARPDLLFCSEIEDLSKLNNSKLYIPKHSNYCGLMDRFSFSSSKIMDTRMHIYDWFDYFHNNFDEFVDKITEKKWCAEIVLYFYIKYNQIPVARTNVTSLINRGNGVAYPPVYRTRFRDVLTFRQKVLDIKLSVLEVIGQVSERFKQKSKLYSMIIKKIKGN